MQRMRDPIYLYLKPGAPPPRLDGVGPFKAVVVVDGEVPPAWQAEVSEWLVRSGCRYMMACGLNCSSWDDSVDEANLKRFDFGDIPEDEFVMTTWHDEGFMEAFQFCKQWAVHPVLELENVYIVHIADGARPSQLLEAFHLSLKDE